MRRANSTTSMSGDIEHVVTILLRTTKALLEALTQWSYMRTSNAEIFEIHDTLEKQFFLVSQAFEEANISMSDLQWIPQQLRDSVSIAMLEQPSPATLDQYLPRIREVIVHLLHGLKGKQAALREKERESRGSIRSSNNTESWNREVPLAALNRGSSSSNGSNTSGSQRIMMNNQQHTLPLPPYPPLSPKMGASADYEPWTGGMPRPSMPANDLSARMMPRNGSLNRPYSPTQQQNPLPTRSSSSARNTNSMSQQIPSPPPPPPPMPPATIISPRPEPQNTFDEDDPNTASALAALKRQENLARRSSVRRASMFRGGGEYNGMGSISRSKGHQMYVASNYGVDQQAGNVPPVPSLPAHHLPLKNVDYTVSNSAATTGNVNNSKLSAVGEGDERTKEKAEEEENKDLTLFLQIGKEVQRVKYNGEMSIPALNMLFLEKFSYSIGQNDFPKIYIRDPAVGVYYELQDLSEVRDKSVLSFNIDEQEEQKKVQKEWLSEITGAFNKELTETRRQFTEQIDVLKKQMTESIVKNNELDEEKEKSWIQQVATQILLSRDEAEKESMHQKVEKDEKKEEKADEKEAQPAIPTVPPEIESVANEQLEAQRIEIEKLRREIAVLRQSEREIREETSNVIAELKEKLQEEVDKRKREEEEPNEQESYTSKARVELEDGKKTLLEKSDQVTNRLEELQDTIDQLKLDVTQRKCRPSEAQMTHCADERKALAQEIEDFGTFIAQVKPRWKKTWEHELQTIVKEQQTLKDQEYLLSDMKDDLDALLEVFEQLEKIYAYQVHTRPQPREFRVAPPEEGFEGMSSVLKQVATIDVDHSRRLRALEQADKMRQRELASRIDEFEKELVGFVDAKKLKKTGGALEIDRLRKQKDEELMRAMYAEKKKAAESNNNEPSTTLSDPQDVNQPDSEEKNEEVNATAEAAEAE
ncbi:MAG: actin interacting protein 3-domain-containing protein [Benjaminiella poitrasii]|nr:MAG: actin interacting protein 3-domain-containing protein [Benjaminiella poitrasii]